ncbi:hypothetical protein B0T25DRAFT_339123 [Lasiosphaeria hispida]|uniref:Uncharacterized protein n=1 Tax=Lasiosphaeria hispida TaxID=260671 RepID=A0AAJ0M817_9PEZI|nr:hypothetical protein B0T25DRAFT_339123 [Lasiosphaeria hispida]
MLSLTVPPSYRHVATHIFVAIVEIRQVGYVTCAIYAFCAMASRPWATVGPGGQVFCSVCSVFLGCTRARRGRPSPCLAGSGTSGNRPGRALLFAPRRTEREREEGPCTVRSLGVAAEVPGLPCRAWRSCTGPGQGTSLQGRCCKLLGAGAQQRFSERAGGPVLNRPLTNLCLSSTPFSPSQSSSYLSKYLPPPPLPFSSSSSIRNQSFPLPYRSFQHPRGLRFSPEKRREGGDLDSGPPDKLPSHIRNRAGLLLQRPSTPPKLLVFLSVLSRHSSVRQRGILPFPPTHPIPLPSFRPQIRVSTSPIPLGRTEQGTFQPGSRRPSPSSTTPASATVQSTYSPRRECRIPLHERDPLKALVGLFSALRVRYMPVRVCPAIRGIFHARA